MITIKLSEKEIEVLKDVLEFERQGITERDFETEQERDDELTVVNKLLKKLQQ